MIPSKLQEPTFKLVHASESLGILYILQISKTQTNQYCMLVPLFWYVTNKGSDQGTRTFSTSLQDHAGWAKAMPSASAQSSSELACLIYRSPCSTLQLETPCKIKCFDCFKQAFSMQTTMSKCDLCLAAHDCVFQIHIFLALLMEQRAKKERQKKTLLAN